MTYYKINLGYSEFVSIDETELSKAIQAQLTGSIVVLANGIVNGKYISHIVPDIHKALGYNYGYKLEAEDYSRFRQYDGEHSIKIEEAKRAFINDKKLLQ